jgi:archaellum component FlaC
MTNNERRFREGQLMKKKGKPENGIRRGLRDHAKQIKEIKNRTDRVEKGVDFILNRVSANGRPGLENSLKDIHSEVKSIASSLTAVLDATKTSRAWTDVRRSVRSLMKESAMGMVLTNKIGRYGTLLVLILTVNSLLHAIDVRLDVQSLLRFFRIIP